MATIEQTVDTGPAVPNLEAARSLVVHLVTQIAPQLDRASIDFAGSLHDVGDIDSLDFLRLVTLTAEATGIVVPPRDYPRLATLDGFARYLIDAHRSAPPGDAGTFGSVA